MKIINLTLFYFLLQTLLTAQIKLPELVLKEHCEFKPTGSKVVVGSTTEKNKRGKLNRFEDEDTYETVAVVARHTDGRVSSDNKFCHRDFLIKKGIVNIAGAEIEAYQIFPASKPATRRLVYHHVLCFQFHASEPHTILELRNGTLHKIASLDKRHAKKNRFTAINEINLSTMTEPRIFISIPDQKMPDIDTDLGNKIYGSQLKKENLYDLYEITYPVKATPFETGNGFAHGPESWANQYSHTQKFFSLTHPKLGLGVLWQDQERGNGQLTWFGSNLSKSETVEIEIPTDHDLAAATSNPAGEIFYITIQNGTGMKTGGRRKGIIYKANHNGKIIEQRTLDTQKINLNIITFAERNVANLVANRSELGLIISRQMHKSPDGLNHQSAISVVFDQQSLKTLNNLGQTSSHSFGSYLTLDKRGNFLGIDLGDAYPRGIHLHRFNKNLRKSAVVFTLKTEHSKKPQNPASKSFKPYPEISDNNNKYYKWSNDNSTYTEIGSCMALNDGIAVVFASEFSPKGRALDNSRATGKHFDPRNLAMVLVNKKFHDIKSTDGYPVPENLILTKGIEETGSFYTFVGKLQKQNNRGVKILTDYKDKTENASRIHAFPLEDNNIAILWEKWSEKNYLSTHMLKIDPKGNKLSEIIDLPGIRLSRQARYHSDGKRIYLVAGQPNPENNTLKLHIIEWR